MTTRRTNPRATGTTTDQGGESFAPTSTGNRLLRLVLMLPKSYSAQQVYEAQVLSEKVSSFLLRVLSIFKERISLTLLTMEKMSKVLGSSGHAHGVRQFENSSVVRRTLNRIGTKFGGVNFFPYRTTYNQAYYWVDKEAERQYLKRVKASLGAPDVGIGLSPHAHAGLSGAAEHRSLTMFAIGEQTMASETVRSEAPRYKRNHFPAPLAPITFRPTSGQTGTISRRSLLRGAGVVAAAAVPIPVAVAQDTDMDLINLCRERITLHERRERLRPNSDSMSLRITEEFLWRGWALEAEIARRRTVTSAGFAAKFTAHHYLADPSRDVAGYQATVASMARDTIAFAPPDFVPYLERIAERCDEVCDRLEAHSAKNLEKVRATDWQRQEAFVASLSEETRANPVMRDALRRRADPCYA